MSSEVGKKTIISRSILLGWIICTLGAIFYCYEYLLRIVPSVMVAELRTQFNLSAEHFGLLTALYYLAYTPMQIVVGVLTDMFGPRKMLTLAVAVCTFGSFLFGYTESVYVASAGRFLIGFGSAFAFVGVLKLAAIWLPSERFALFAGLATALGMVGAMVGDVELSLLVRRIGWQDTIFLGTVFGLFLTPMIWLVVRDSQCIEDPDLATEAEVVSLKQAISGVFQIARNKQMWYAGFIGLALYLSLSVFAEVWGITFLQSVYGYTSEQAAFATAMVFFGWLVGAPIMGLLSDVMKSRKKPLIFGCIASLSCVITMAYLPPISPMALLVLLFLFGMFSSTEVVCFAIGRENCPEHMSGAAVAFINMLVMFGGFLFQPLAGFLLDFTWTGEIENGLKVYSNSNYMAALSIIPICLVLSFITLHYLIDTFATKHEEG